MGRIIYCGLSPEVWGSPALVGMLVGRVMRGQVVGSCCNGCMFVGKGLGESVPEWEL